MKLIIKNQTLKFVALSMSLAFSVGSAPAFAKSTLSLQQAIQIAQKNDPWLQGNRLKESATLNRSIAAGTLPDPRVSIAMMNLPADSWELDQENMTQVQVSVSQMLPRGDSNDIRKRQLQLESNKYPLQREDRLAKLKRQVSQLWMDVYLAQETIKLIKQDQVLFEQMAEVAKASYSTAVGRTRQQDVIRAQLELLQLEDRLTKEQQALETASAKLNQWLYRYDANSVSYDLDLKPKPFQLPENMPGIKFKTALLPENWQLKPNQVARALSLHPAVLVLDVKQDVSRQSVELSKQKYKPQWGINASYGYRDDRPSGESRSDLFSIGVSFDLPLFTESRQDKERDAAIADSEAVKTEKLLVLKNMLSEMDKEQRRLTRLSQRQSLYETRLLTQAHEQAEVSLTAYTNDDGDFAEVVRARIAELNARIALLDIKVNVLKSRVRLNYFLTQSNVQMTTQPSLNFGDKS